MTSPANRLGRFEAPVDYAIIRRRLQRVRAVFAATIAAASVGGLLTDVSGAWLPAVLAGAVLLHALVRGLMPHSAAEWLVIDAFAIATGLWIAEDPHAGLIAAAAYLIAAAITFGGVVPTILTLLTFAVSLLVRPLLPLPYEQPLPPAGDAMVWVAIFVFLSAVALSLTAAATTVGRTRVRQQSAYDEVRRASEMKNQFVSMVTHELRTPLTNIAGFAETLRESWRDLPPGELDEFLQIIMSESEHLKNLVEDVLAIPRLEAGRLLLEVTDFQLGPAAFRITGLIFPEGGAREASVSIGGNVVVSADPNRVEQVLRNLLENARKYGGEQVTVEAVPDDGAWKVIVSDTGAGLPIEHAERVFDAFEQVTKGDARTDTGFGLGLAVAKNLVEAMGGRIWYEPGFPIGARFCFTLPAARTHRAALAVSEVA